MKRWIMDLLDHIIDVNWEYMNYLPTLRCVMTCVSGVQEEEEMQWNPSGGCWVSSAYKHRDGAKGVSSTNVLAHQFPPPLSSRHLFWLGGQGIGV